MFVDSIVVTMDDASISLSLRIGKDSRATSAMPTHPRPSTNYAPKRQRSDVPSRNFVAISLVNRVLDRLWVGSADDLSGQIPFASLGFSAILDLRDGDNRVDLPGVEVLRVSNRDGDPWSVNQVHTVLDFIWSRLARGCVLVACAAGRSRSVSVITTYLVRCGWGLPEALVHVRACRPEASPSPSTLDSMVNCLAVSR